MVKEVVAWQNSAAPRVLLGAALATTIIIPPWFLFGPVSLHGMAYGQPVRSVISVWCSPLLPLGYTRLFSSLLLSYSRLVKRPFSLSLVLSPSLSSSSVVCLSRSPSTKWWCTRYEKKRDWSDGNPSAGIDAILDIYRDTQGGTLWELSEETLRGITLWETIVSELHLRNTPVLVNIFNSNS